MNTVSIYSRLRSLADPAYLENMARFGISMHNTLGIAVPELRKLAKEIGTSHELALQLWDSGVMEARIIATLIDDPALVTEKQMDNWVSALDSWNVCDACCGNLFDRTPFAIKKAFEWSSAEAEYVKRAGFALMAYIAVHNKKAPDELYMSFLPAIAVQSYDDRNFVKKAVNWALREIGKRNSALNEAAIKTAEEIYAGGQRAARWIATDALRELQSEAVRKRLGIKEEKRTALRG